MTKNELRFEPIDPPWYVDGLTFIGDAHDEDGVRHHIVAEPGYCGDMWRNARLWSADYAQTHG